MSATKKGRNTIGRWLVAQAAEELVGTVREFEPYMGGNPHAVAGPTELLFLLEQAASFIGGHNGATVYLAWSGGQLLLTADLPKQDPRDRAYAVNAAGPFALATAVLQLAGHLAALARRDGEELPDLPF